METIVAVSYEDQFEENRNEIRKELWLGRIIQKVREKRMEVCNWDKQRMAHIFYQDIH